MGFFVALLVSLFVVYLLYFFVMSTLAVALFWEIPSVAICLLLAVLLATFAALRGPDVANDFTVYQDWYSYRDAENGYLERPGYFEALYFLLNDAFAAASVQFRIFVGILAFVAVFIKTKVILNFSKSSLAAGIGILVYLFTFYLLHEFTQIRAGLAVAFIFLAVQSLVNERRAFFFFWILVAAGFHSSAVVALLLLLPYHDARARWLDWVLLGVTGMIYVLAALGIGLDVLLIDLLSTFDPRVALYISMAEGGYSNAANPFAISAILLLLLALFLMGAHGDNKPMSELDMQDIKALVLIRRSVLIGLSCLALFSRIPEIALRLFEINTALIPILVAIVFSRQGWFLQKFLLLLWTSALIFIYIWREDGLVQPYVLFFA